MPLPRAAAGAAALLAAAAVTAAGPGAAGDEFVLLQLKAAAGSTDTGGTSSTGSATGAFSQADGRIPVWIWWDYNPNAAPGWGLPAYQEALISSWKRFAPSDLFELHYVNHTNILDFLPDFPVEAKRMYVEAKTDVIRSGLLAKHGGVYFDADFLLARPLREITDKLNEVDFVTYSNYGQSCTKEGTFSSNFMAARKGNIFSETWYDKQKRDLAQRCTPGEIFHQPTCCYTPEGEERECHVPWGHLGEGNGQRILRDLLKIPINPEDPRGPWTRQTPEDATISFHCFSEDEDSAGFAPFEADGMWGTLTDEAEPETHLSEMRCQSSGEDLTCAQGSGGKQHRKNFFCRHAYHLFTKANSPEMKNQPYPSFKQKPLVMAKILRKLEGDEERHCADA